MARGTDRGGAGCRVRAPARLSFSRRKRPARGHGAVPVPRCDGAAHRVSDAPTHDGGYYDTRITTVAREPAA
jgi:hypothetical protein